MEIYELCERGRQEHTEILKMHWASEWETANKSLEVEIKVPEAPQPYGSSNLEEMTLEEMKDLADFHWIKYHHASKEPKLKEVLLEAWVVSI